MKGPALLAQREREKCRSRLHADILPAAHGPGHRSGGNRWTEIGLPQHLSGTRIESVELPVAAAAEEEIGRSSQNARFSRRSIQLEIPLLFASLRIDGANRTINLV